MVRGWVDDHRTKVIGVMLYPTINLVERKHLRLKVSVVINEYKCEVALVYALPTWIS